MDVPRHSNINLANHQGILEELWIFKFDGFYLSSVKASLPGCWCCLWKGRVEMEFNTSLEVYCLEGNWEYLQSRMKSYQNEIPDCMLTKHFLPFWAFWAFGWAFWILNSTWGKTHTWKFPERWNGPAVFLHVMFWPMIQLTGLVLDHFEGISIVPFLF